MAEPAVSPVQAHQTDDESSAVANGSVRRASLIAGVALLVMTVLAAFGNFGVLEGLITPGDATGTATALASSESLFRLGIASLFVVAVLDLIVAWALYTVFAPVNERLSLLAGWLRAVFAGIFVVAISQLAGVLPLLDRADYLAVFSAEQLDAQVLLGVTSFYDVWNGALILVGLHLVVVGYLAYVSGYVNRLLGVLLVVAGLGYVVDSFGLVLSAGYSFEVAAVTFVGEVLLVGWLLVRGRRLDLVTGEPSPVE